MAKLERKLRRYRRMARFSYAILLLLIPVQTWQVTASFTWMKLALLLSSIFCFGSVCWVLSVLKQVEEKLSEGRD